ncbi:MAG: response regulator [Acidimicrobiia bacterium]
MRVIIADDHKIVREGLRLILAHDESIDIVGEAEDGNALLELLATTPADVILLDLRMPGLGGLDVLERMQEALPQAKVVVLTMHDDAAYIRRAIELGVSGYLLKSVDREELLRALRRVVDGHSYIQGDLTSTLVEAMIDRSPRVAIGALSLEDRNIIELLAEGLDNRQLAQSIGLSEAAVKARLRGIYTSLGVRRRSEAVAVAIRLGLVS